MDLIDTHQHLMYRDELGYSWADNFPPIDKGDFTLENYKELTKGFDIKGTLFMETGVDDSDYKKEANFIKSIMDQPDSNMKGLIVSIRPEDESGFDEWLEKTTAMNVSGYRRIFHTMPDELSQKSTVRDNVKKIGAAGKPFDICYLPTQLKIAAELVKECDQMDLVLNHCGVPPIASGEIDEWGKDLKSLSEMPNVTCKLSGLMAYCAPGTSSYDTIKPYVDHALECFGPDRMVWGSDYPVVNAAKGIQEWIKVTNQILGQLSEDEAKKIASSNAERIYKV
ncbi:MAG: amidohydrolase [Candidatus Marinimicrobia bacterium]|nr:amidohydrolase [Candidatus Neomarinimicrobiota bacterium]|tara:strand:+ start:4486 stop:5328 length:843 start_codon:yes stop_codon:yes gene_type:complete